MLLDPKEWKKQDHYEVLGLSALRYKATDDQIKIARAFLLTLLLYIRMECIDGMGAQIAKKS